MIDNNTQRGTPMANIFVKGIVWLMFERPGKQKDYDGHLQALDTSANTINTRLASAEDNASNRDNLCHIIGIERWAQRRMQIALGEAPIDDEYDGYRPSQDATWDDLTRDFHTTREATCALVKQLQAEQVAPETRVPHNMFGDVSLLGWLQYINGHADRHAASLA
jgi:hypothetical protein